MYLAYRRTRYELRCIAAGYPRLYRPLIGLKSSFGVGGGLVGRETQLAIQAFPRSGNTFATQAFLLAQQKRVKLAHHLHSPGELMLAARWGVPGLLVVRQPTDSVCSFIQREQVIGPRQALRNWSRFHKPLMGILDAFVVATFEQIISDFGAVIERINRKYGTDFDLFEHTDSNVKKCFELIEARELELSKEERPLELGVARPSKERASGRASIIASVQGAELTKDMNQAAELFKRLQAVAEND